MGRHRAGRAEDAARAVVKRSAAAETVVVIAWHGTARSTLKLINAVRRRERPTPPYRGGTDTAPVEYLYGTDWQPTSRNRFGEPVGEREVVVEFRITKKTARRIYYSRDNGAMTEQDRARGGYVDRQAMERDGHVRTSRGYWEADSILFLDPPDVTGPAPVDRSADLSRLKAEMADAHPDRGGTNEAFIVARRCYEQAVRRVRAGGPA